MDLEPPYWMNLVEYQTYGAWITFSIEKSLWLHYFHSNDSQVRKNFLSCLFYDSSQVENRKYRDQTLWEFWRDTKKEVRQQIFKDLIKQSTKKGKKEEQKLSSIKDSEEERGNINTIENHLITGSHFGTPGAFSLLSGWRVGTKVLDQIKIQDSLIKFTASENKEITAITSLDVTTQNEIVYLLSIGNNMYEIDYFINFLTVSKLDRWELPFDNLWRRLYKIIDETQRELTLKELLEDDRRSSDKKKLGEIEEKKNSLNLLSDKKEKSQPQTQKVDSKKKNYTKNMVRKSI